MLKSSISIENSINIFFCLEDLLAHQEEASSQNRLLALEKKVQLQADEILCLKSSLADVIRRLQTVEAQHHAG